MTRAAHRRGLAPREPERFRGRAEPWRDWAVILLLNHGLLIAAAAIEPPLPWLLVIAVSLGLGIAMATLTVLHDAGHRRFARGYWPNMLAVQTAAPVGLWVAFWTLKHRLHHRMTAVFPVDEFTHSSGLVRLHPAAPWRPIHRFQHIYTWPLYAGVWLGELRSQLRYLARGRVTGVRTPSGRERAGSFLLEKAVCVMVLLPYGIVVGPGRLGVLLVTAMTVGGFVVTVVLVVGHINTGLAPTSVTPSSAAWTTHLLATTASFSTSSAISRWVSGGMTLHLAHHLRPTVPRRQLPQVHQTVVAEAASQTGQSPIEFTSFSGAVKGHWRQLRALGRFEPAAATAAPLPPPRCGPADGVEAAATRQHVACLPAR